MKVEQINNPVIKMELTMDEAKWLKGVMQNPLSEDCNPMYEDENDTKYRTMFYGALSTV